MPKKIGSSCNSFHWLLLVVVQNTFVESVQLPMQDVDRVFEIQQRKLLPQLLHFEKNRLYDVEDLWGNS